MAHNDRSDAWYEEAAESGLLTETLVRRSALNVRKSRQLLKNPVCPPLYPGEGAPEQVRETMPEALLAPLKVETHLESKPTEAQ